MFVELSCQQRERKWHEVAGKQQQPTNQLNGEKERCKMRRANGNEELNRQRICRRRLMDEVKKPVQAKNRKHQSQQIPRNNGHYLHASSPLCYLRASNGCFDIREHAELSKDHGSRGVAVE